MRDDHSDSDKTKSVVILSHGMLVGHYRIIEKIGSGGMGEVYLAEDTKLDRKVALKFLSPHLCQDEACRQRFEREAQAAAKLDHPNIVTVYEVGEFQGRPFFAMQHIEGQSLREHASHHELSIPQVLEIGILIAEGLQAAHEKGVTHRDIKPANVLIDSHGRARILDFGLASVAGTDHLTKTGSTLGTVGYMSPEQVRGEQVDHRTDIFSLGVVLYELITGRQPFKGDNDAATSRNIIDHDPEPLARYKSGINAEFQRVISKALAKDKSIRYQHADDLVADLKRLASAVGSIPGTRNRKLRVVLPSLVILVVVVAILILRPWSIMMKPSEEGVTAVKCVVVVPFRNQTGDPSLDPLGKMVADWTTQSLLPTGLAEAVPTERLPEHAENLSIRSIVDSTGASMIVTGSYYKIGDSIQFQAQVLNAEEKLLQAIDPIYSPTTKVMDGVESVRQKVLGALAVVLDERLQGTSIQTSKPPTYEAYREYMQGRDAFDENGFSTGLEHFKRTYDLDTSFLEPLLFANIACWYLGQVAAADSIKEFLNRRLARLSTLQQLELDELVSFQSGDWTKMLDAMRKKAKFPPAQNALMWGQEAIWANRPQEAIEAFKMMNPKVGWVRDWRYYWIVYAQAYHFLGNHQKELEVIREGRKQFPTSFGMLNAEISAHAAMGRLDDVKKLIGEVLALPRQSNFTPGGTMRIAADELRAHGFRSEAEPIYDQAIRWYQSQPAEEMGNLRYGYALTLYNARRWGEAKSIFEEFARESPTDPDYQTMLGLIAAHQEDRETAMKISEWLKDRQQTSQLGDNIYGRARIAAVLGDKDQAVSLMKEAFEQRMMFTARIHTNPDLESLWGYPLFQELMRPKG